MNKHNKNKNQVAQTIEWLTIKEVKQRLKISRTTVYELTRDGKLTAYKIGNSVRYKLEEVENALVPIQPS